VIKRYVYAFIEGGMKETLRISIILSFVKKVQKNCCPLVEFNPSSVLLAHYRVSISFILYFSKKNNKRANSYLATLVAPATYSVGAMGALSSRPQLTPQK